MESGKRADRHTGKAILIRVTDTEYARIKNAAIEAGTSMTDYARGKLLDTSSNTARVHARDTDMLSNRAGIHVSGHMF